MALGDFVANGSHGSVTFKDGTTPTALENALDFENADVSVTGIGPVQREVVAYARRGKTHGLGLGDPTYPQVSFTGMLAEWTNAGSGEGTLLDLILGKSGTDYAARVSTLGANHPVICFDIEYVITDDAGNTHDFTLHDVHVVVDFSEGNPSTLSFTGTVYGGVTGDIVANEG